MSVVRRGSVGAVVLGLALVGGPAWAQEDPCAPGPDGSVPEMCQSGPVQSDTGTVGIEPEPQDPCPAQPVEPGDGTVTDEGDQGIAVGEPNPGAPPSDVEEEPAPEDERVDPEQGDPATEDASRTSDAPVLAEDGIVCAFAMPQTDGATATPESAGGQLPRTGPYDRLLAVSALGSGLVVVGAGAAVAGRRRRTG